MPRRMRRAKRRRTEGAPLDAWANLFDTGYDFFGDLEDYGIRGDEEARAAAREAWAVHGAAFLAAREAEPERAPWALREFGPPEGARHAD